MALARCGDPLAARTREAALAAQFPGDVPFPAAKLHNRFQTCRHQQYV